MYFVGVDLAWGDRKPTGLAVLDADGHLVHVSAAGTDDEIVAALEPYVEGDCLVAIDAPLIVTNATGNRPAEAALNKDFARFDAGAHPSNTGKPEFSEQPRGARIAARLGLDMNPRSGRARRAIEVYPHPATVALFRLGRTLKYKNKPGRDLEQLRSELIVLVGLLEGLADGRPAAAGERQPGRPARHAPPGRRSGRRSRRPAARASCGWSRTRSTPSSARTSRCSRPASPDRHHDVRRLRDRLHRHPDPAARTSSRRRAGRGSRRRTSDPGGSAVREYAEQQPALRLAADQFVALVTSILDDAGINYLSVTGRAKSVASFAAKAARTVDGRPLVHRPAARDHRPDRGPGDHLRAQRRAGRGRPARRPGRRPRRPRHGAGDGERGPVRLRQPAPADRPRRRPRGPAGVRAAQRPAGPGPDPDGAAARVGGVRARHPLQGHDPRRARARLRPPVHAGGRAARARRPRVLHDPRPAPGRDDRRRAPRPRTTTRGSARASSRRSWPGSTPTRAGRAPTTTPGSPGCCSSSASPRWPSSATCCGRWTPRRSPSGWTTATRRAPYAGSTTRCSWAYGDAYVELRGNAHRVPALRARLEKMGDESS